MPSTPEDSTTDDLVVRARGNRDAFGELYDTIYPAIFRYCVRRVSDRSQAEDITSIVFLHVAANIAAFRGSTYREFRRWVFTIATNEIKADYRKMSRRQALLVAAVQSGRLPAPSVGAALDPDVQRDSLQEALMQLSDRAQAIVVMRFLSELPYEDIGLILNITPGTVRTAASRAIAEIKNHLRSHE